MLGVIISENKLLKNALKGGHITDILSTIDVLVRDRYYYYEENIEDIRKEYSTDDEILITGRIIRLRAIDEILNILSKCTIENDNTFKRNNYKDIVDKRINVFMKGYYKDFKPKIQDIDEVVIYKKELQHIELINEIRIRRLAFVLLVYAKIFNLKFSSNSGKVPYSKSQIFEEAKLKTNNSERLKVLHELMCRELKINNDTGEIINFINGSFKSGKGDIYINYVDEIGEVAFTITDFSDKSVVYRYLDYCGDKWSRCVCCGKWFKDKSITKPRKYCNKCKKDMQLKCQRESMSKSRKM